MIESHELMQSVIDAKPVNFDTDFAALMQARVAELVADKKIEIAQNFFGDQDATVEVSDELEADTDPIEVTSTEPVGDDNDQEAS